MIGSVDLRRLEMFLGVVDAGTFAAAADTLGFVQSTISAGVHTLERELGVQLFDRSARAAVLTPAGEALVPEARELLARAALVRRVVTDADHSLTGELRIGVINSTRPVQLPRALAQFHAAHPRVRIQVLADAVGTSNLVERLRKSELDLVIASGHLTADQARGLVVQRLGSGRLVCIGPADAAVPAGAVRVADVAGMDWIEAPLGQANRATTDEMFRRAGLGRVITAEVADPDEVPDYVSAGLGLALVPDFVVADGDGLRRIELDGEDLQWSIAAIRLAQRDSSTIRAFWDVVTRPQVETRP